MSLKFGTAGLILVIPFLVFTLAGCSGENVPDSTSQPAQDTPVADRTESSETPTQTAAVDPQRPETKWIGTIPYDVYYDDPLTVAS